MIKKGISFVNVLLAMKEQTVKMVSKNNGQKSTFWCVDSVWEISANKLSYATIFMLACKILDTLFNGSIDSD